MIESNALKLYSKKTGIISMVFLTLAGLISSQIILTPAVWASSQYELNVISTVRNLTSGQGYFSENINASNGDRLMFQIQIQNTGANILNNVIVRDSLPSYVSYAYGTSRLENGGIAADNVISGGINIGSISSGSSRVITFEAIINYTGANPNLTLTNSAYAHADQTGGASDAATIFLTQAATANNLNIANSVSNSTSGQTSFSPSVSANAGDRVNFLIELTTPSNAPAATNLRVWDVLPAGLTYIDGSARLDGNSASDNLVSGGINLGTMFANQGHRINFAASVNPNYSATQTLTNSVYVSGDGVYQRSASCRVIANQATMISGQIQTAQAAGSKTAPVAALTGSNSRTLTFVFSIVGALMFIFLFYFLIEYTDFWRDLGFKLAIARARMRK